MTLEEVLHIRPAFADKRGVIYNVLGHPIEHVAVIVTKRGAVRGNHVHEREVQYCYILKGRVRCEARKAVDPYVKPLSRFDVETQTASSGDLIITPPGVAHKRTYLAATTELALYTVPRLQMESEDTFRFEV